jgi:hypothetical protein
VIFKMNGQQGASPVIFGEKGDSMLLGTVSLEALGFILDPIRRELRPLPMVLGAHLHQAGTRARRSSGGIATALLAS